MNPDISARNAADDLRVRFAAQMRRAFFDKLRSDLENENPEAVEWLIKLHAELQKRLAALRPGRAEEIADKMDNEIFARKLRNRAFRHDDMHGMVNFSYEILSEIVAPDMDASLSAKRNALLVEMQSGNAVFSSVVPTFLQGVHELLDESIARIQELYNNQ